ncbi:Serine/threonine-protein kinase [Venturia nashicola]|uniref:Serine/threonine-protein kinase n=1 Tax=Venturia nashicola TaxID=86259 RepID=A0A4Z1PI49_9PEZI|nr:Serine/threonine-protein kinase [Venturia nashicola]
MEEQGNHMDGPEMPAGDMPSATTDLGALLAELAKYSSAPRSASEQQPQQPSSHQAFSADRNLDPWQHLVNREQQTRSPLVDPSTILEWPLALRCVNKLSAQNPHFGPAVKVMISDQARNVQQWWADREGLLKVQAGRKESVRQLNETLKAVGGTPTSAPTPEEDKAEIDKFDLKVYTASKKMSEHHSAELKRLGVPFFGVNPKLIIMNDIQQFAATSDPLSQATITEAELIDLQRRMIQYLEDLYKD